jgi:hypothetical protein
VATINLPYSPTYIVNQYNILAPPIGETAGYVLKTNNNLISINNAGGFSINNPGIYKITMCFSFFYSNAGYTNTNTIPIDIMLNGSNLTTPTDLVNTCPIYDTTTCGTALTFNGLTNNSLNIYDEEFSTTTTSTGFMKTEIVDGAEYYYVTFDSLTYTFYLNPSTMYYSTYLSSSYSPSDPAFFFSRYYLSTYSNSNLIPQVLYFTATVSVTDSAVTDNLNYFYPCICPYNYNIWNDFNNITPQPYLMVELISSVPS